MAVKHRLIIDTDPGVDDVLAILLALAARADEIELLLISLTFGNVDVRSCLRNVIATFHMVEKELKWRKERNLPLGFEAARTYAPVVAVGAEQPLQDAVEHADFFHGRDGLAGIHSTHPHFSPEDTWQHLFEEPPPESIISQTASRTTNLDSTTTQAHFSPSLQPAHKEILRILRSNPPDTVTIISIGPLTNLALAAAEDPVTFVRAREVISMGGAVEALGNVTPTAEFNVFADPHAAARVYALTSQTPSSTMPLTSTHPLANSLASYPPHLPQSLKLTLMALDITERHVLTATQFSTAAADHLSQGSPLASWLTAFLTPMFAQTSKIDGGPEQLALHDPMCVYYLLTYGQSGWAGEEEDIRVETMGQWTKGMTLRDDRAGRKTKGRRNSDGEAPHDRGNWWGKRSGNRVKRMASSPGEEKCAEMLLDRLFGGGADKPKGTKNDG